MSSILESVEWGKPALSLLSQCNELDPDLPAVIHIRHTERPEATQESLELVRKTGRSPLLSTEKGEQASIEFGASLPNDRYYRFYHSPVDRATQTAEQILRGISDDGDKSQIMGIFDLSFVHDMDKFLHYLMTDSQEVDSLSNAQCFFFRWVGGRYPPSDITPSLEFAQNGAALMMKNLRSAVSNTMDVYVSHDVWIASFLLHWFGITPFDRVGYLDGFIVQFNDEKTIVYYRDEKLVVTLPYWWVFTS